MNTRDELMQIMIDVDKVIAESPFIFACGGVNDCRPTEITSSDIEELVIGAFKRESQKEDDANDNSIIKERPYCPEFQFFLLIPEQIERNVTNLNAFLPVYMYPYQGKTYRKEIGCTHNVRIIIDPRLADKVGKHQGMGPGPLKGPFANPSVDLYYSIFIHVQDKKLIDTTILRSTWLQGKS